MSKTVADDEEDDLCVVLGLGLMGALVEVGWVDAPGSSLKAVSGSVEAFHTVVLDNTDNDEVEGRSTGCCFAPGPGYGGGNMKL